MTDFPFNGHEHIPLMSRYFSRSSWPAPYVIKYEITGGVVFFTSMSWRFEKMMYFHKHTKPGGRHLKGHTASGSYLKKFKRIFYFDWHESLTEFYVRDWALQAWQEFQNCNENHTTKCLFSTCLGILKNSLLRQFVICPFFPTCTKEIPHCNQPHIMNINCTLFTLPFKIQFQFGDCSPLTSNRSEHQNKNSTH